GKIESERLAREQVYGDGVGAEGVNDEQAVQPVNRFRQADAGITEYDLELDPALCGILQVGEVAGVPGDVHDGRVDLVEGELLTALAVARQRPGSEADQGDVVLGPGPAERFEHL